MCLFNILVIGTLVFYTFLAGMGNPTVKLPAQVRVWVRVYTRDLILVTRQVGFFYGYRYRMILPTRYTRCHL
jgi:hypothetical protein